MAAEKASEKKLVFFAALSIQKLSFCAGCLTLLHKSFILKQNRKAYTFI